ncbi:SAC3/GANP family protein [Besnoitia besnoiti]|uniref:SAC3/GANP family protein n=1 Tax=Besnoitia besnoiti TaxID=94643 RepID=A0A2A9M7X6_BESBE|nr:SAC3/GANP family protein [Besnoitia besnoiti]PFH31490.1 SAC3/GANP family protein [Besnoitia besnoiti]
MASPQLQTGLQEAQEALHVVREQYVKGHLDLTKAWQLLQKVKIFVTLNPLSNFSEPSLLKAVALVGQECFELAALLSVAEMQEQMRSVEGGAAGMADEPLEGEDNFERHMLMLLPYYTDYAELLPPSQFQGELLCLYLLSFLASNRIGEFHMALQMLAPQIRADPRIAEVLALEQHLIEGSYGFISELQRAQSGEQKNGAGAGTLLPASAHVFIEKLVKTVRLKAAACLERAHDQVDVDYAMLALNLNSLGELEVFVELHNLGKQQEAAMHAGDAKLNGTAGSLGRLHHADGGAAAAGSVSTLAAGVGSGSFAAAVSFSACGEADHEWEIQGKVLKFHKKSDKLAAPQHCSIQALNVIGNLIEYATELERIV